MLYNVNSALYGGTTESNSGYDGKIRERSRTSASKHGKHNLRNVGVHIIADVCACVHDI